MLADVVTKEIHEGRWLSPDPLGGDITNPQSLNRYAYVLNNPTTLTDPLWATRKRHRASRFHTHVKL